MGKWRDHLQRRRRLIVSVRRRRWLGYLACYYVYVFDQKKKSRSLEFLEKVCMKQKRGFLFPMTPPDATETEAGPRVGSCGRSRRGGISAASERGQRGRAGRALSLSSLALRPASGADVVPRRPDPASTHPTDRTAPVPPAPSTRRPLAAPDGPARYVADVACAPRRT